MRYLIGVGFEKCGTTSLYHQLAASPRISPTLIKESFFFNRHYHQGPDYLNSLYRNRPDAAIRLDITPSYWRNGLWNIHRFAADKKILLCLRHPVERAFSYYLHLLSAFHAHGLPPSADQGGPIEPKDRFSPIYRRSLAEELARNRYAYVARYFHTVKTCFDLFGRDRVHCLILEEWAEKPSEAVAGIEGFLDIALDLPAAGPRRHDNQLHLPFYLTPSEAAPVLTRLGRTLDPAVPLYLCAQRKLIPLPGLSNIQVEMAQLSSRAWTDRLDQGEMADLFSRYYRTDIDRLENLLNRDLSLFRVTRDIRYEPIDPAQINELV